MNDPYHVFSLPGFGVEGLGAQSAEGESKPQMFNQGAPKARQSPKVISHPANARFFEVTIFQRPVRCAQRP